jgi:hypothetical protein
MMVDEVTQYVCFIKRRTGARFIPYTLQEGGIVVKTMREFLDNELLRWNNPAVFLKITLQELVKDVEKDSINSFYATMLGWNYPVAARLAEEEGVVFVLIIHPHFEGRVFSVRRVHEEDDYALHLVEQIWSLRGGGIVFQKYDSTIHFDGCEFQP